MSDKEISALQPGADLRPGPQSTIAAPTDQTQTPRIPEELSILPVRGFVVFPGTVIPLNIQRAASLKLLDDTLPRTKVIGLVAQRDETKEDPAPQDLYSIGTVALVLKLIRESEDHVLVIAQGRRRFSLRKIIATSPFLRAEIDLPDSVQPPETKEWEATFRNLRDSAARLFELTPDAPEQARLMVFNIDNAEQLADFLAPNLNVDVAQKQAILEELDVEKRVHAVQKHISAQLEINTDLPWNKLSKDNLDLDQAQQILDSDHYDLEKVKRRLIEYLAVRKLNPQGHGAILCFLGPPGVGKTSLGQSIADALGRKFVRISLGGMRDEAEIRGHRRTYIGSMPGRIIQELRRCGTRNPVFMLDE